jgi:hypothetical protein
MVSWAGEDRQSTGATGSRRLGRACMGLRTLAIDALAAHPAAAPRPSRSALLAALRAVLCNLRLAPASPRLPPSAAAERPSAGTQPLASSHPIHSSADTRDPTSARPPRVAPGWAPFPVRCNVSSDAAAQPPLSLRRRVGVGPARRHRPAGPRPRRGTPRHRGRHRRARPARRPRPPVARRTSTTTTIASRAERSPNNCSTEPS